MYFPITLVIIFTAKFEVLLIMLSVTDNSLQQPTQSVKLDGSKEPILAVKDTI
jgi:uncharacterized protein (DUF2062 family)